MGDTEHSPASNDIDEHRLLLSQWPYQKKEKMLSFYIFCLPDLSYFSYEALLLFMIVSDG